MEYKTDQALHDEIKFMKCEKSTLHVNTFTLVFNIKKNRTNHNQIVFMHH